MMKTNTLKPTLAQFLAVHEQVENWLEKLLPAVSNEPADLYSAMRYSVLAGGKRIRPILAVISFQAFGGSDASIIYPAAAAVEMMHTYSLIHDDLPCMDDDDFRRGLPTLHKKYSEYLAVLAGDALHALAFEILASSGDSKVVQEVGHAIGTEGMIGGQVRDVQAEGQEVSLADVAEIHKRKTAALISASVKIGAMLAKASPEQIKMITIYGEKLGLAFQVVDDILDVEGDSTKMGKSAGSDDRLMKATYPRVIGLEKSKQIAAELITEAKDILINFSERENFCLLADYILSRGK